MTHIHHTVAAEALERRRPIAKALAPLRWWRTTEPQSLDAAASAMLQAAVIASVPNHPPSTGPVVTAAVDAARVIRAALLTAAWAAPPAWAVDLAGSALLICAADGNATARLVLDHFRRRFAAPKATSSNRGEA